jgi:hypothetical protein
MRRQPQSSRRVTAALEHLGASPAAAAGATIDVQRTGAPTATASPRLLNDWQIRQFVTEGFLLLPLSEDLSPEFHASVHAQVEGLAGQAAIGNNIFPAIPALGEVLSSPTVNGALCSVLGHDYALHAHRALHRADRPEEQGFHKDGQEGHGPHRHHRPRWAMVMYYPAGCTLEMAPTAILPGGQCKFSNPALLSNVGAILTTHIVLDWHTLPWTAGNGVGSPLPTATPSASPSSSSQPPCGKGPPCCCISICSTAVPIFNLDLGFLATNGFGPQCCYK